MRKLSVIILLLLPMMLCAQQRATQFNPDYAIGDFRVEYGRYASMSYDDYEAPFVRISYSRLFWRRFAYRAGVQAAMGIPQFDFYAGVPLSLAYKPWTESLGYRLLDAATFTVADVVADGIACRTENMLTDALANFVAALFRRSEYFIGVTPGMYFGAGADNVDGTTDPTTSADPSTPIGPSVTTGTNFSCTADAGFVLGVPIWRMELNFTTAYHYSLTPNYYIAGEPCRSFFSLTAGISYLF